MSRSQDRFARFGDGFPIGTLIVTGARWCKPALESV
jgi:hypothetical protein